MLLEACCQLFLKQACCNYSIFLYPWAGFVTPCSPSIHPPLPWCSSAPGVQERVRNEFIEHVVPGVPVTPLGDRPDGYETYLCLHARTGTQQRRSKFLTKDQMQKKTQPTMHNTRFKNTISDPTLTTTTPTRRPRKVDIVHHVGYLPGGTNPHVAELAPGKCRRRRRSLFRTTSDPHTRRFSFPSHVCGLVSRGQPVLRATPNSFAVCSGFCATEETNTVLVFGVIFLCF